MSIASEAAAVSGERRGEEYPRRPRVLALCEAGSNERAASYALRTLLEIAGSCCETQSYQPGRPVAGGGFHAVVSYGSTPPSIDSPHLHIAASGFFDDDQYLKRNSVPRDRFDFEGISA